MEPSSFQLCPVTEHGAVGTETQEASSEHKETLCSGTGFPGLVQSSPWRSPKATWMLSGEAVLGRPT